MVGGAAMVHRQRRDARGVLQRIHLPAGSRSGAARVVKAIAPAYSPDRRYTDDCHYKGGCLRGYYDVLTYGLGMVAANALPPHAKAVGPRWADIWRQRLEESEPYL